MRIGLRHFLFKIKVAETDRARDISFRARNYRDSYGQLSPLMVLICDGGGRRRRAGKPCGRELR
ncbi:hypothetical protein N7447_002313 [Penicillium robsamsonii]|uniref:uncharacterized protein n=1 Tax=Penicillium robsamsonii TaxID=1792511 RepID=UPI0025494DFC|nr:uncharacterized protein N7447_002313 [Penicillium robsamsonii]KAJ5836287.1 hypothetical protein N7447_002313 [Penicillium robsamsonii]